MGLTQTLTPVLELKS